MDVKTSGQITIFELQERFGLETQWLFQLLKGWGCYNNVMSSSAGKCLE
jgi:hypothetical protein